MKPANRSYLYLALCIFFWASIPVASKQILTEMNNFQMLFWSTLFSALVMGAVVMAQGKAAVMRRTPRRAYAWMVLLGFLGAYLYYVLLYAAIDLTVGAQGFILAYTWPILVSLLAVILLGERFTLLKGLSVLISFGGVAVIVTQGDLSQMAFTSLVGDLLALAGAFVFALFSVLGKGRGGDQTVSAFVYFLAALVCVAVTAPLVGVPWPSAQIWPWLIYNGVLVNGITYVWWFKALAHGETFVIANALYLTPALSLLFVFLFLSEPVLPSHLVGLTIILAGIWLGQRPQRRPLPAPIG
jgi:drug/metabolite transporter (DMT)-like permease